MSAMMTLNMYARTAHAWPSVCVCVKVMQCPSRSPKEMMPSRRIIANDFGDSYI